MGRYSQEVPGHRAIVLNDGCRLVDLEIRADGQRERGFLFAALSDSSPLCRTKAVRIGCVNSVRHMGYFTAASSRFNSGRAGLPSLLFPINASLVLTRAMPLSVLALSIPSAAHDPSARRGPAHRAGATLALIVMAGAMSACSGLGAAGPRTGQILKADKAAVANQTQIQVVPLDEQVARRVIAANAYRTFAEVLGGARPVGSIIGPGDVLAISIWEAPPAVLFGPTTEGRAASMAPGIGGTSAIPEQMVDRSGTINVPYVGTLSAAGRTTRDLEAEIVRRLAGKAHEPQVIVRVARNASANVTVMGDVATSARVPLSAKGERLLDVLAAVGGSRQPVSKTAVQITRGSIVTTMPLQQVVQNPAQNVIMQSDDVVNVMFQPYSFTALGAVANNAEVPFEGTGITLAQALGRMGGLRDDRADVRGVFVFRLEDPTALSPELAASARRTIDGKVPVIYRLDLGNPAGFFIAQDFPIMNRDVVYVSNAPIADFQKFVNIVSSMTFSIVGLKNL